MLLLVFHVSTLKWWHGESVAATLVVMQFMATAYLFRYAADAVEMVSIASVDLALEGQRKQSS